MHHRWLRSFILLPLLFTSVSHAADTPQARMDEKHRAFFTSYCVECHNEKKQKGKLRLDDISFALDSVEKADAWQKILNQINSGEMPPDDAKQPERTAKTDFLEALSRTMVVARKSLGDARGKITMRRLNRREYKNTIRDLLGVDVRANELPADGGAGTFDTVGSSLFMSSDQFEQYLALGRQALDEHFARFVAPTPEKPRLMHIEAEEKNARIAKSLADRVDAHERYEKWTAAVEAAAQKPENADIAAKIRAEKPNDIAHFQSQWQRIAGVPSPKNFGFADDVEARHQGLSDWEHYVPHHRAYVEHPATKTGAFLTVEDVHVNPYQAFRIPGDWPAGDYVVRVRIAATNNSPASRHFVEFGSQHDSGVRAIVSSHQVTGTMEKPQVIEIPLKFSPANGHGFFFQEKGSYESEDAARQVFNDAKQRNGIGPEFALWIDWIEVGSKGATPQATPQTFKTRIETETQANKEISDLLGNLKKDHDRYSQWTAAVDAEAAKPENTALVKELRELPQVKSNAELFYIQWEKHRDKPSCKQFGYSEAGVARFLGKIQFDRGFRWFSEYLAMPDKDRGSYLLNYGARESEKITADAKWPAGTYTLRVRLAALDDAPADRRFIQFGQHGDAVSIFTIMGTYQVTGTMAQPQILEIPVNVTSAGKREFAIREKQSSDRTTVAALWHETYNKTGTGPKPALWIDWMELEGPVNASAQTASTLTKTDAPHPQKLRKDPEQWANKYMPIYTQGYEEKFGRYQKWCAAIDEAAKKPENADIARKLRDDPKVKQSPHLFYNRFAEIAGAPAPTQFGFKDVDDAQFARSEYTYHHQYYADYAKLPQRETGAWLMLYSLGRYTGITAPANWPAGKYTLRVRLAASDESPKERRFIEIGTGKADAADFNVLSAHQVTGTLASPQTLEIPVEINASGDRNFAIRDKRPNTRDAENAMWREAWEKTGTGPRPCIWVDFVELEGPMNAAGTSAPGLTKTTKERREVELHANAMVGGTYNGYFKQGYEAAKKFMETGMPQKGIPDEQEAKFRIRGFEQNGPTFERYLNDPLTKTGAYLTIFNVHPEEVITLPPDQPSGWLKTKHEVEKAEPGEYMLRFRIGTVKGTPKERHFVAFGSRMKPEEKEDFTLMQTFQISGTTDAPQTIEVPVSISANGPRTFVLREKRDVKLDHELFTTAQKETGVGPPSALWIDWVEWEGPLVKQAPVAKVEHIEPEKRRADVERGHLRSKYLNEQYAKWKAAGGDEARLKEFDFTDKSHAEFAKIVWEQNNRWFQQYLDRPLSKTGLYLDNTVQETSEYAIDMPTDIAAGEYVMRVKIGRVPDMPAERAFLTFVEASPIDKDDRTFLANKQITATLDTPEIVEMPFKIRPGGPRKFILMEKRPLKKEAISLPGRTRQITDPKQRDPVLWIDWIEYEGPLAPVNAKTSIAPVLAAGETNARKVLETFAQRAFRGKTPSAAFLDKLTALHENRLKAGDSFDKAIREPLSVILASPGFLYLQETGAQSFTPNLLPKEEAGKKLGVKNERQRSLSPPELASRLSYFLWSAPPDEQLLKADLARPEVIVHEVDRMIADARSSEFVSGFVHQWLGMERLDFFQFDTKQFRDFDESAKAAARREVYETFAHLLRSGGSLARLLRSDEIFVNGLLATYYGIEGVSGDEFRKVTLPAGSPRGGLLGMAAILAMGSNGERTSPVERGAWILRKLLHDPPPPAPPNVPQLTRLENKLLTTRERLVAHQEEPQCAQCHRKIDPIGFGLENFNAAGKWRTEETYEKRGVGKKTWPIDPAGTFHNGPAFKDYFELRDLIASKPEKFARSFTEALIEYALGRPYGFSDEPLAEEIVKQAKEKNYTLREFIIALTTSREFARK